MTFITHLKHILKMKAHFENESAFWKAHFEKRILNLSKLKETDISFLTLLLPEPGRMSLYMSVIWQHPVGIGLKV